MLSETRVTRTQKTKHLTTQRFLNGFFFSNKKRRRKKWVKDCFVQISFSLLVTHRSQKDCTIVVYRVEAYIFNFFFLFVAQPNKERCRPALLNCTLQRHRDRWGDNASNMRLVGHLPSNTLTETLHQDLKLRNMVTSNVNQYLRCAVVAICQRQWYNQCVFFGTIRLSSRELFYYHVLYLYTQGTLFFYFLFFSINYIYIYLQFSWVINDKCKNTATLWNVRF